MPHCGRHAGDADQYQAALSIDTAIVLNGSFPLASSSAELREVVVGAQIPPSHQAAVERLPRHLASFAKPEPSGEAEFVGYLTSVIRSL